MQVEGENEGLRSMDMCSYAGISGSGPDMVGTPSVQITSNFRDRREESVCKTDGKQDDREQQMFCWNVFWISRNSGLETSDFQINIMYSGHVKESSGPLEYLSDDIGWQKDSGGNGSYLFIAGVKFYGHPGLGLSRLRDHCEQNTYYELRTREATILG